MRLAIALACLAVLACATMAPPNTGAVLAATDVVEAAFPSGVLSMALLLI